MNSRYCWLVTLYGSISNSGTATVCAANSLSQPKVSESRGRPRVTEPAGMRNFLIKRQLMQHVSQSFKMHQPVFDGHLKQSSQRETVAGRGNISEISSRQLFVQRAAGSVHIVVHIAQGRPIRRNVGRQTSAHGIDAESKEPVKLGLHTLQTEDTIPEQIPVERFEVSDIKDNPVALRDRPLVEEFAANNIKERVASAAS